MPRAASSAASSELSEISRRIDIELVEDAAAVLAQVAVLGRDEEELAHCWSGGFCWCECWRASRTAA